MTELDAGLIDVFANGPLEGNPLAVVMDADNLPDDTLRRIAGELNQAETTFLFKSARADARLRSFTASGSEVFGAGHNALGAWLWLAEQGRLGPLDSPTTFLQEIGSEVLPVTLERRGTRVHGTTTQSALQLGPPMETVEALAAALELPVEAFLSHPAPRVASTGARHLMVRLRDRETVDRARPCADALRAVLESAGGEGCYVYAFDPTVPRSAYARFFNPTVGLWEDSATGTAAGPLCAYLGSENLLADDQTLVVEQGVKMGRRSLLHVRLTPRAELSGSGVIVLRGALRLQTSVESAPLSADDQRFLRRAIELAHAARAAGQAPFGSLLVGRNGDVLREEHNTVLRDGDISAHPELKLARWAARELPVDVAGTVTLYTSCQPCKMCAGAIKTARLHRVVYALSAAQLTELKRSSAPSDVHEVGPALSAEALRPFENYYD